MFVQHADVLIENQTVVVYFFNACLYLQIEESAEFIGIKTTNI